MSKKLEPNEIEEKLVEVLGPTLSTETYANDALRRNVKELKERGRDYTKPLKKK